MQPNTLTTINELVLGDRFYYHSDRKKEVWEVTGLQAKAVKIKGFVRQAREVTKRKGINELFTTKKMGLIGTHVIFLRNIL